MTFKSNNKNDNYINKLLSLPLLKHTHAHTHAHTHTHTHAHTQISIITVIIIIIPKKATPTSFPKE